MSNNIFFSASLQQKPQSTDLLGKNVDKIPYIQTAHTFPAKRSTISNNMARDATAKVY
jgi:hypothetical protein